MNKYGAVKAREIGREKRSTRTERVPIQQEVSGSQFDIEAPLIGSRNDNLYATAFGHLHG